MTSSANAESESTETPLTSQREKIYSNQSPDRIWDYIVIGSGMGGMTTAALLSQLGKKVLILEQHYVPGGFTHTFRRKGWVWDVGVHAVGEVTSQAVVGRLLSQLTGGRLEWTSLGPVYDEFYFPNLRIDFANNKAAFVEALDQAFPNEKDAITRYFQMVKEVSGVMKRYYLSRLVPDSWSKIVDPLFAKEAHLLLTQRTSEVLDGITKDPRLKTVLTAQWGYYGSPPERSSFAIHALVARHFLHGGYYPVGGSARIAQELLKTVADAGGWTRINAEVASLVVERGKVQGVELKGGEFIESKYVVSAIGALPTVERLLPESERAKPWAQSIKALKPSPCHVCLYMGFKGDIRKAGATAANKWFYEVWESDATAWNIENPNEEAPVLYCSFPSLKDPHHVAGEEQMHTGEVVTFVPYELFAKWRDARWKRRGEEYEALKKQLTERLLEQFFRHMPDLKPMLAFAELSTPVTTEHFTRASNGAIYGLEPTPQRYKTSGLRPITPLSGLYLSGADMASVGVIGAMMGGLLCAVAAEPFSAVPWLRKYGGSR